MAKHLHQTDSNLLPPAKTRTTAQRLLKITKTKTFRCSTSLILVFFVYVILFATWSSNDTYSIAGGAVGAASSVSDSLIPHHSILRR